MDKKITNTGDIAQIHDVITEETAERILKEVDNIENWKGSAYQSWSSDLGNDEVGSAIENIKLLCLSAMFGEGSTTCQYCEAEVYGSESNIVCPDCGQTIKHCNMCDGGANQCAPGRHGEEYRCFDCSKYCHFRVDHNEVVREYRSNN